MPEYYECHITMLGDPKQIKPLVDAFKWKFSVIDGDSVLGEGIKCYATKLFPARLKEEDVKYELATTASAMCFNVKVTRTKIARVIYDDRSDKVKVCNGGCEGCHLEDHREKNKEKLTHMLNQLRKYFDGCTVESTEDVVCKTGLPYAEAMDVYQAIVRLTGTPIETLTSV